VQGVKGDTGSQGIKGDTGAQGIQGVKGDTGDTGPAGPSVWGGITGTLSTQTDLQTALNAKAPLASPTLTGAVNINATTLGFFGVTLASRPTAYTQTYSTASKTHAAVTQLACPAGGTGAAAGGWSTAANRDLAIASINAARTDIANLKNLVNAVIDDLQALGLLQ
jgi:hypothetical protein